MHQMITACSKLLGHSPQRDRKLHTCQVGDPNISLSYSNAFFHADLGAKGRPLEVGPSYTNPFLKHNLDKVCSCFFLHTTSGGSISINDQTLSLVEHLNIEFDEGDMDGIVFNTSCITKSLYFEL